MKLFSCPNCRQRVYFENAQCLNCSSLIGYCPERGEFVLTGAKGSYSCLNAAQCDCNWTTDRPDSFCCACSLNKTIPDLTVIGNQARWKRVERAKKRAVYTLMAFGLPVGPKLDPDDEIGLAFDFLADPIGAGPGGEKILTGHDNGLITLNVSEADSSTREKMRAEMGENYRTLLGHFRHELGHYYWDRLIRDDPDLLGKFRALFGDESASYEQALQNHYANGAPLDWQLDHISAYAASHPWEDWAETWAHYLHITDTLEMVSALNMPLGDLDVPSGDRLPARDTGQPPLPPPSEAPAEQPPFARTLARWLVLSEASNSINRCMGLPDLYPFVISSRTGEKLTFVHDVLAARVPPH